MAERVDLEMIRGDTYAFGVRVTNLEGAAVTGMFFTIRKSAADAAITAQKRLGDGITAGPDGYYRVRLAPEDTRDIAAGKYAWDLEVDIGEDVYTPVKGTIRIEQDVTY